MALCIGWAMMLAQVEGASPAIGLDRANSSDLFTTRPMWRVQIDLASQDLDRLRTDARQYVRARLRVGDEVFSDVGLHLKGSGGSYRGLDDKPGFTLDFGRFVVGQALRGVRKIHLNNSVEDPTYLKEQLGSELFRAAQVPVPGVTHARVDLNGRSLGLYVLKEGFTEDFLRRHFLRADGNLYDTDQGHDVDSPMKRHLGRESADDQTDLRRLALAATEPDLTRRLDRLQEVLDVDRFLTFMAMEVLICHWDGYCLGRNNFRVYHDPGVDRVVFMPSGMDQLFSKADMPWKPDMAGLVARAVMGLPQGQQGYTQRLQVLLGSVLNSERIAQRVQELVADLRRDLPRSEYESLRRDAADLCSQVAAREAYLRKQLGEPEPPSPVFHGGCAGLGRWQAFDPPVDGKLQETEGPDRKPALQIVAGARTSASWRTTVRLDRGRYDFRGRARVNGVVPMPFGSHQGASLRVVGREEHSAALLGTSAWQPLAVSFAVAEPQEDIILVCELRGSAGEAWFEKTSLMLTHEP
jgi:spore coat protein H